MSAKGEGKKRGRLKEDPDDQRKRSRRRTVMLQDDTTTLGNQACPNFLLNSDVASEIFSFLDIRSLYNVTMTSKESMKVLRHEHVVRSSLMQGGHSKTNMERLVPLIEKRCIWIPSPLRMLRLVNAKTCEHCCKGRVHLVSESFGVFFCFHGCIQGNATKGVAFNKKWSPFLVDQPRIAKSAYSSSAYIWVRPFRDGSGERCGPLISMVEMQRIMQGDGTVETLLEKKDAVDPHTSAVTDIVKVFKDTTEAAARRIEERRRRKVKASLDAHDKRKKKLLSMVDSLHAELDDVPWKNVALAYQWRKSNSKEVIQFECGLTEDLLHDYSTAPSKATKKKLKEVTRSLRDSFGMMEQKGFLDFSFLSDSDPVERAVQVYCIEKYPNYKIAESRSMKREREEWIRNANTSAELLKVLLSLTESNLVAILAPAIVSSTVAIRNDDLRKKAEKQAMLLSARELGAESDIFWTPLNRNPPMTPLELYNTLMEKFPRLFQNTLDFLQAPATIAWKEKHAREGNTRRVESVVDGIWDRPMSVVEPLLQRKEKEVLKILEKRL